MEKRNALYLFSRYAILFLLGINDLFLFYFIFTPLTFYTSLFFLNMFFGAVFYAPNVIFLKGYFANIVPACVAGAAYYFLLILNLTTPMPPKKRFVSMMFTISLFFILNVTRIVVFGALLYKGYEYFDLTHKLTWYIGSTAMVVAIWFLNIALFRIRTIPILTDTTGIIKDIKHPRKKVRQ